MASAVLAVPDFTFVQVSDTHSPSDNTKKAIAEVCKLGEVELEPYHITALAPSFVINTGDLCDFGGGDGTWETYIGYWANAKIPVYNISGNHDGTWWCIRRQMRELYGQPYYSFNKFGCHFIGLDSSSLQDFRPNFGQEEIEWLQKDLKKIDKSMPLFVYFHHPLYSDEFASEFEKQRILDIFKPYNLVLFLCGHTHNSIDHVIDGFDSVEGGSTRTANPPDYSIISIKDNVIRVACKKLGEEKATLALLEKKIPEKATRPLVSITSPKIGSNCTNGKLLVKANISPACSIKKVTCHVDDRPDVQLSDSGPSWFADVPIDGIMPGRHFIKVSFELSNDTTESKSTSFNADNSRLLWRTFLHGSCKGAAVLDGNTLYVGSDDCKLYALSAVNGKTKWTYKTNGDIVADPLVVGDTVYAASDDAYLYALTKNGKLKWKFQASGSIFSSPVYSDGLIYFGCNGYEFYAVNAKTGKLAWKSNEPKYTCESKPFVKDGVVYFGAWDTFIYALNAKTGALKWKCEGQGSRIEAAAKYYSPADCGPVATGNNVFCADRKRILSIIDAASGNIVKTIDTISSACLSQDGKAVYARSTKNKIMKLNPDGSVVWTASVPTDLTPSAPAEGNGIVYTCESTGILTATSAKDGSMLWQYQVVPSLRVYGVPCVGKNVVFLTAMDGSVTALKTK